ncbi:signal transduction histidine kinase [Trueperella bonasi]|uniref:histidine kinase n=1 Tax=Trueperella bonasi TaxID=312286 RepID=A0ABT9NHE4_9ACTO|nr:sensor histidine kinase [Trueperella bonasi]MDP9806825.1 signal transduction histidine kinase [Trueperella bonasi]
MKNFATIRGVSPFDLVLALIVVGIAYIDARYVLGQQLLADVLFYLAVICLVLGTFFRRLYPTPAAIVVYVGALLRYLAFPNSMWLIDIAVFFALYAVLTYGSHKARWPAIIGAVFGACLLVVPALHSDIRPGIIFLALFGALAAIGVTTTSALLRRQQYLRFDDLIAKADMAQRNSEREAELAVVGERTRIAREMHDIVAHTLSVVIAQADGGRYAAKSNPEAAERALTVIADMSRAALGDIRSIIGVLRDPNDADAPLAPEPIDSDLTTLIEQVRESGQDVSFVVTGQARPLPVGVGNAVYRICQEALTNSLKHAGPHAQVTVALHWRPAEVILNVTDNGRGAAAADDGKGHGLIGMNERAAVFGGTVVSGPRQGGGFKVTATIPTPTERTSHV